jgi:hypothetical protein
LIHGGRLSAARKLRPTNGCIRLHDEDMADLVVAWWFHQPAACEVAVGTLAVFQPRRELDATAAEVEPPADPPPLVGNPLPPLP